MIIETCKYYEGDGIMEPSILNDLVICTLERIQEERRKPNPDLSFGNIGLNRPEYAEVIEHLLFHNVIRCSSSSNGDMKLTVTDDGEKFMDGLGIYL